MINYQSKKRSENYIKQVKGAALYKLLAVALSFFTVRLMIQYLGIEQYGVWSTLVSLISWIVFFDLGIGNGLQNKISEAFAKNKIKSVRFLISSSYSLTGLICLVLFLMLCVMACYVPWQKVFNTEAMSEVNLRIAVLTLSFFIFLNFWIAQVNQILNAIQKSSLVVFGQLLSNVFLLTFLLVTVKLVVEKSITLMAAIYGFSMAISNILLTIWFFKKNKHLLPNLLFSRKFFRSLITLGGQFFILQMAFLVVFTTDKILITQLFGPGSVAQYEVVFKLFSVITLSYSLIASPLWASYSDAFHKKDFLWMRLVLSKQFNIFFLILLFALCIAIFSNPIIKLWIGNDLEISNKVVISMGLFVIVNTWNNIFSVLVNGIGMIRPQVFTSIIAMIVNVPIAFLFTKVFGMGVHGIILATTVSLLPFAIVGPIQVFNILYRNNGV